MARKLNRREKYSLYFAASFMFMPVILEFAVFPAIDNYNRLQKALRVKTGILEEVRSLKSEHDEMTKKASLSKNQFKKRERGFTLFSFLDKLAGETGLKDRIIYMKPSTSIPKDSTYKTSIVEMKLQAINLSQLTTYLHRVETSSNMLFIKRISISKTEKGQGLLNAVLNVETYEL